ncbi:MAG: hypothetical protein KAX49_12000 [Halanaerobiales bacterium]|nr:hypothetical protein [Halanaerobiales bacterium]
MKFIILSKEDLFRMMACLFLGIILGSVIVNLILGYHFDQLIYENKNLSQQLEEEQILIKQLENAYYTTPVVRKVVIELISSEDKLTEKEIEKKVKDLLTGLIGLKINQLDNIILRDILHKRIISLNGNNYRLELETIIIDDDLTFVVRVKKHSKNDPDDE